MGPRVDYAVEEGRGLQKVSVARRARRLEDKAGVWRKQVPELLEAEKTKETRLGDHQEAGQRDSSSLSPVGLPGDPERGVEREPTVLGRIAL